MTVSSNSFSLFINGTEIEVTRKRMKTMRLRVGADGKARLSAPLHTPLALIEAFAYTNASAIERARARVASSPVAAPVADRGTFMLWGRPVTIRVERSGSRSKAPFLEGAELIVPLSDNRCNEEGLSKALDAFLVSEVKRELEQDAVPRMEAVTGVHAAGWKVRSMRSRWGSCQVAKRTITINSQLAHYDRRCLDYVVCHELCHLYEPSHNARFHALMDRFHPGWKAVRKLLSA